MISVIVPVYNPGKWFDSCISSLLEQTYTDIEILLIDDGSTDGSGEKCDNYAKSDPRFRVFHTQNHGVSHARNIGIREAHGDYIAFVDSDDWLERTTFSCAVQRMKTDSSQLAIYAMQIDRYTGNHVDEKPLPLSEDETVSPKEIAQRFGELFYADYLSSSCTKLFSRTMIVDNDLFFDETLVMYEDLDFVLRYISLIETVSLMKMIGYHYRMDTTVTAVTKRKTNDLLSNIHKVVNGIIEFCRSQNVELDNENCKPIIDLYLIHLHQLFAIPFSFSTRMKGIRRLFKSEPLKRALIRCQTFKKQGRFYRVIAICLVRKWALPIYVLYRKRY